MPFRAGEEVLVEIVEPHMYEPRRRGREGRRLHHLGHGAAATTSAQKRLVRIEEAGATEAIASLWTSPRRRAPSSNGSGDGDDADDARIEASAPWPQRRTAPFRLQGRVGSERTLTSE